ncbi:hypothetical protein KC19_VG135600 [Ceratodon purpureus]|uniref:Uncharacterized protein n=1 Tax=Ceratodon purpureus TaxID=3225 RepID=A0A8T0HQC0_CERPU|nr:hypothetical protein KC19_VG135600 [Ceratodon purpureus]
MVRIFALAAAMEEPFERLLLDDLIEVTAQYFTVTMISPTKPFFLEIPADFSAKTGWPACKSCALVTSQRTPKEWPLQMFPLSSDFCLGTLVSESGEWLKFVAD